MAFSLATLSAVATAAATAAYTRKKKNSVRPFTMYAYLILIFSLVRSGFSYK